MSTPPSMPIPAGWYPDPAGSFQQRWWTGESWTNDFAQYRPTLVHSAPAVEVLLNPLAQPRMATAMQSSDQQATVASARSTAQQSGQQAAHAPTTTLTRDELPAAGPVPAFALPAADQPPQTTVAQPNAGNATLIAVTPSHRPASLDSAGTDFTSDYQPFGSVPGVRRGHRIRPDRRNTVAAWLLAVLPAIVAGAGYAIAALLPVIYTTVTQLLLLLIFLAISIVLAAIDRNVLQRDGHVYTASAGLALLTPLAYLAARAVIVSRETERTATGPLVLLLIVAAAIAAALLFVGGLLALLLTASAI